MASANYSDITGRVIGHWSGGGGGGSQTLTVTRVPIAFNTPNIVGPPGIAVYTPAIGDLIVAIGVSVVTAWDGTTPTLEFTAQGLDIGAVGEFATAALDTPNNDLQTGGNWVSFPSAIGAFNGMFLATATTPLNMFVDDNSGGNPGSTRGAGEVFLVALPAA